MESDGPFPGIIQALDGVRWSPLHLHFAGDLLNACATMVRGAAAAFADPAELDLFEHWAVLDEPNVVPLLTPVNREALEGLGECVSWAGAMAGSLATRIMAIDRAAADAVRRRAAPPLEVPAVPGPAYPEIAPLPPAVADLWRHGSFRQVRGVGAGLAEAGVALGTRTTARSAADLRRYVGEIAAVWAEAGGP